MRTIQTALRIGIRWLSLFLALAACTAPPERQPTATSPAPTPTQIPTPLVESIPAGELLLNEDPPRLGTFNINTLAHELPGMEAVEVKNYTYAYNDERALTLDLYYPPDTPQDAQLPLVIFGIGYRYSKQRLRNAHFYTSWGRLVAAGGMAAAVYDTEQPDRDLDILMNFFRYHGPELKLDIGRIGFMSSSANCATVMSYLMQPERSGFAFSVYYYGLSLTPDRKFADSFEMVCSGDRCLFSELADVRTVDPDMPVLIVQAGQDFNPHINEALDYFAAFVREGGALVTVIRYEEGEHGFETQQKTTESAAIIQQTLGFMQTNFDLK